MALTGHWLRIFRRGCHRFCLTLCGRGWLIPIFKLLFAGWLIPVGYEFAAFLVSGRHTNRSLSFGVRDSWVVVQGLAH